MKTTETNRNFRSCQGLGTNAPRLVVDFELGVVNLGEKTFFDAALIAEEFGIGKSFIFIFQYPKVTL